MGKNMKKIAILIAFFVSTNAISEELSPLSIFGGQATDEIAGSASFIDDTQIKKSGYTDIERLLNEVPGVYSQTEDGLGLRTNIGMRGVSAKRTTKTNITEDGILQGPAVYSNPSMYFFPDTGRAEGIEVLKGAAAIGTGPRSTGGAINIISRSIPTESKGYYGFTMGDNNYHRNHTYYGDTVGNLSYVFEIQNTATDGHKDIEAASGNDTNAGFRKQSDLFKLRYTMPSSYIELSSQNTTETSHESYLGLTRNDFTASPYRRYGASSIDKMDNDYHRYILTYNLDLSPATNFVGKLYKSKYSRNWKKAGDITVDDDGTGAGVTTSTFEMDAINWGSDCSANSTTSVDAAVIQEVANELRACNIITGVEAMLGNESIKRAMGHRDYGMYGYDLRLNHVMGNHDMTFGYRSHHDYRNREDSGDSELWTLGSNNTMTNISRTVGAADLHQERKSAWADSISFIDKITHGNFLTILGVRHEDVDYEKLSAAAAGAQAAPSKYSNSETMYAASTAYSMGEGKTAFIGFSQGYSPTGPSNIRPEESDNYEIGYRSRNANGFMELVAFYVDYDMLNETCGATAGCGNADTNEENAGEAHSSGVEFTYKLNNLFPTTQMKGAGDMSGIRYPFVFSATFQESERDVNINDTTKLDGNSITYTPEEIFYISIGAESNDWDYKFAMKYNDEYFTNDANTIKTESAWIVDFQGGIKLDKLGMQGARAFVNVDNLLDKTYLASNHEYGNRPNKPQSFMAGVTFDF
jgi:Fe(3+) dicitrate transport protein